MKTKQIFFLLVAAIAFLFISCEKEAGEGGNSSIFGKVYVKDYNGTFTVLNGEYYGSDEDVYIIYGEDKSYSDHISTNYDGTYEFKYLRPGIYTVYAYSKDSTLQSASGIIPVIQEIEITDKNTAYEVPDLVIFN
jgi:hypothetical protein